MMIAVYIVKMDPVYIVMMVAVYIVMKSPVSCNDDCCTYTL
jgi:hypothetical protein